jgi:chaperone modulatory protein CbpM
MIDTTEFLVHARIDAQVLETWVAEGWLVPRHDVEAPRFAEIDVARAQLIHDLRDAMGVNDEGVTVILDLVDQIHGLRRTLRGVMAALDAQPETTRRQIVADARRLGIDGPFDPSGEPGGSAPKTPG